MLHAVFFVALTTTVSGSLPAVIADVLIREKFKAWKGYRAHYRVSREEDDDATIQ
jgi:hypothetical protein